MYHQECKYVAASLWAGKEEIQSVQLQLSCWTYHFQLSVFKLTRTQSLSSKQTWDWK